MPIINYTEIPFANPEIRSYGRGMESWHDQELVDIPIEGAPTTPKNFYVRSYIHWYDLEPNINDYRFDTVIGPYIRQAIDRNQTFGFGIMTLRWGYGVTVDGAVSTYPVYLHNLMQAEGANSQDFIRSGQWIPNYNSENYIGRLRELHRNLANWLASTSYNGVLYKNVISYIDIRGFGNYGEWHHVDFMSEMWRADGTSNETWPVGRRPSVTSLSRIVDAHTDYFGDYNLCVMIAAFDCNNLGNVYNPPGIAKYVLQKTYGPNNDKLIGWRRDNWGSGDSYADNWTRYNTNGTLDDGRVFNVAIMDRWKYAPVGGEPGGVNGGYESYWYLPDEVDIFNMSFLGNGNFAQYAQTTTLKNNFRLASKKMGHRLVVSSINTPDNITTNTNFQIIANWQNKGNAPTYHDWQVTYELQNRTTNAVVWSGQSSHSLRFFLPSGSTTQVTDTFSVPTSVPSGQYRLVLKVKDSLNYRLPLDLFITEARRADGSYLISDSVNVLQGTDPVPSSTPTPTVTPTRTPGASQSVTPTRTVTPSRTRTPGASQSVTPSRTPSVTPSRSTTTTSPVSFTEIPFSDPEIRTYERGFESWHDQESADIPVEGAPTTPLNYYVRSWYVWSRLEPTQGNYTFDSVIGPDIRKAIDRKSSFSLGIMTIYQGSPYNVNIGGSGCSYPAYLHNLMQSDVANARDFVAGGQWIPNYNSSYYLNRLDALHIALDTWLKSNSYNGVSYKDVISYIDIRGFGDFGEWHHAGTLGSSANGGWPTGRTPTVASLQRIVDSHCNYLSDFQLVAMIGAFDCQLLWNTWNPPQIAEYIMLKTYGNNKKIGWRRDNWAVCPCDGEWYIPYYLELNDRATVNGQPISVAIMDRWKEAPITGEPWNGAAEAANGGPAPYWRIPNEVDFYHVMSIGNGNATDFGGQYGNLTQAESKDYFRLASKKAGHRLILTSGNIPSSIPQGASFQISLNWQNKGVAPIYSDLWRVTYELQNRTTNAVVWSSVSSKQLKLYLPSATPENTTDTVNIPTSVPAGNYRLVVKVKDSTNFRDPLVLYINGRRADGSYTLVDTFNLTTGVDVTPSVTPSITATPSITPTRTPSVGAVTSPSPTPTRTTTPSRSPLSSTTYWIFPDTDPGALDNTDSTVNLGVRFRSTIDGRITKVRFWKSYLETNTLHQGAIWTNTGTKLADLTFSSVGISEGWVEATLTTPLLIMANTDYVASYRSIGAYAKTENFFNTSYFRNSMIASAGLYSYGTTVSFPTQTYLNTNYWIDVFFELPVVDPTPSVTPSITSTPSLTPTRTPSVTPTRTVTPSISATPSISRTPSITPTRTVTPSVSPSTGAAPSSTPTVTPTSTISPTPSITPSLSPTRTPSISASVSRTPSRTPSISASNSVTPSVTVSSTPGVSSTPSITPSITPSLTPSITPSISITPTKTVTPTRTITPTRTVTPSVTPSSTPAASVQIFNTNVGTPSTVTNTADGISIVFDSVTVSGNTLTQVIQPNQGPVPTLPDGYQIQNTLTSFNVSTTAAYSGSANLTFELPTSISKKTFDTIKVFRVDGGVTTDVTVTSGSFAPNFSTLSVSGRSSGFGTFYVIAIPAPAVFESYTLTLQAESTLYEKHIRCRVLENEFNMTTNPTVLLDKTGTIQPWATGSDFRPYITTIGMYNDRDELLMVAKLAQPLPVPKNNDMTIVIKYDM